MRGRAQEEYIEYVTGRLAPLRQLAYLLCGDEHRADDIVQLTIEKLYMRWPKISAVEHQYVRQMLVRTFLDERRRPWARVTLARAPPEPPPRPGAGHEGPQDAVDQAVVLRAALARVPRRQQAVIVLRYLCDLLIDEVAELLGCSPGTGKSQCARGLDTLRRIVGDDLQRTV